MTLSIATLQGSFGNSTLSPDQVAIPTSTTATHGIRHLAIIMDGNGRWAKRRNLPRLAGHKAGTDNLRRILKACREQGIRIVTLYAFSTENWKRPYEEVNGLMKILEGAIDRELEALHEAGVCIRHIGRTDRIPAELYRKIQRAILYTRNNTNLILNVAMDYGGRAEIVDAVRRMLADGLEPSAVDETTINRYLYTGDLPDPDLIIRTSGEYRVSNFMIWQAAYAEYYVTDVLWPDFDEKELQRAIEHYTRRDRRFGGLKIK